MTDRQQATEKIHAMMDGIEAGINVERWHDLCTHDRVVALKCLIMAGLVDKTDLPDGSANLDFVLPRRVCGRHAFKCIRSNMFLRRFGITLFSFDRRTIRRTRDSDHLALPFS